MKKLALVLALIVSLAYCFECRAQSGIASFVAHHHGPPPALDALDHLRFVWLFAMVRSATAAPRPAITASRKIDPTAQLPPLRQAKRATRASESREPENRKLSEIRNILCNFNLGNFFR